MDCTFHGIVLFRLHCTILVGGFTEGNLIICKTKSCSQAVTVAYNNNICYFYPVLVTLAATSATPLTPIINNNGVHTALIYDFCKANANPFYIS